MLAFIKPPKTEIKISCRIPADKVEQLQKDLQTIIDKCNPDQLSLLSKAVSDPIIKAAALLELKQRFKD